MTNQIKREKTDRVSSIVFVLTISIVLFNIVSLFFPALVLTLASDSNSNVNPFESGAFTLPLLVTNVIVFYFWYLYNMKKIPDKIRNSVKFIQKFEVSRKVAAIVIVIILGGYVVFTVQELSINEILTGDFPIVERELRDFPFGQIADGMPKNYFGKYLLLYLSQEVFQNIKIVPFISSISLLLVTYFLTLEISKKRFAGIIAMIILLQSYIFLRFDTTATYSNFWTLFFVLSLYMIYKRWYLSPVSYFLSIFSKAFTVFFLPMVLFFTYRASIPREKKIRIVVTYVIITAILVGTFTALYTTSESYPITNVLDKLTNFSYIDFVSGFTMWGFHLRFDALFVLFILPLTVGLFVVSRKGIPEADSILILIFGIILSAPLLAGLTTYNLQPYACNTSLEN